MVTVGAAAAWAIPVLTLSMMVDPADPWSPAAMMVPAGAAGAAVLAVAQAVALRRWLSAFPVRRWTGASVAAGVVEWSVIALVVVYGEKVGAMSAVGQVPLVVAGMVSVTFALGVGQWFVLRRWSDEAVLWIWANAVAWIMGTAVFVAAVVQPVRATTAMTVTAATITAVVGALLRGAVVAAITGVYLLPILSEAHLRPGVSSPAGAPSRSGYLHAGSAAGRLVGAADRYPARRALQASVQALALRHVPGNSRLWPNSDAPAADS
ncbi:hypothetical protein HGA13_07695 [Nocardia speluncae]|uniref:Uncharacterized protein n=1 Tax=Nocardia speluncae TaxID=419477 RepID=A0A846XE13_9NOCA|nr:hypothetical protein [Nocardia speluncae]NKY32956.1 hypothetical protein [Nocardia speluncae]